MSQGPYSLRIRRFRGIGIPIINLRRFDDSLGFILEIPIQTNQYFLSENKSWINCTRMAVCRALMNMMTSSKGTFSELLAICAGKSPVPGEFPGQWRGASMFSLICVWINGWVNNREAGDLRRYRAHYDVTVMVWCRLILPMSFRNTWLPLCQ